MRQFLAIEDENSELWQLTCKSRIEAILATQSTSELMVVHREALRILLQEYSDPEIVGQIAINANEFLAQALLLLEETKNKTCSLTEMELRESETKFRSMFEQIAVGICYTTIEGGFLQTNQKFCEIVGYTSAELQAMKYLDITYPEDRDLTNTFLNQLSGGEISNFAVEKRYVRKGGDLIWVHKTVSLIASPKDGSRCLLAVIQDISDRKQVEMSLKHLNEELETRVAERTSQLSQLNRLLAVEIAERQRTEARLAAQIEHLYWVNDLASNLNTANTLDGIYNVALKSVQQTLKVKRAAILIIDDRDILRYQVSIGLSEAYKQAVEQYCASQSKLPETQLVTITDAKQKKGDEQLDILRQVEGIQAAISFPIQYQGKQLGKIVVYYDAPRQFSDAETQLVQAIATYTSVAITRKNSEIALLESQRYAESIAESVPDILYVYDLLGQRVIYMNEASTSIVGYTPAETIAMGSRLLSTLVHPDDLALLPNYCDRIHSLAIGEVVDCTYRIKHANGEWRWMYSRDKVFAKDASGRTTQYIGTARDITDERARELKLKHQLTAMEASADGIAIVDLNGTFTYANNAHAITFGYSSAAETIGKHWKDLYAPETIDFVEKDVVPIILATGAWKGDLIGNKKDGTQFPVEVSITSISNEEGHLEGAVCIYRDISDRKQAEEELKATQRRFQSILDNCPAAIYVFDKDGRHILVNRFYEQKSGYTNAELYGKTLFDVWEHDFSKEVLATINQTIKSGKSMEIEETVPHDDGFIHAVTLRFPLLNDRGIPDVVCSISTDITDRRRAELKLEESLKEKELLLQEIHHRVKNNLQVVASLLNLQQRTIKDPAIAQLFEDSRNRIYAMAAIHERLYQSKQLNQIDLGAYVRDLVSSLIQSHDIRNKDIQFEINTDLIEVNIETAIPCGLIVNELVINIFKHAFPDRSEGRVLVECLAIRDGRIRLNVCDNGVGIPAHIDFNRASSLGLRIINQLSRQLKGEMKIEAANGTCFSLRFSELKYRNRV